MLLPVILFALGQTAPAVPTQVASTTVQEKQICKRYAPVGSNIANRKQCMTRAEWDKYARDSQALRRSIEQPFLPQGN